MATQLNREAVRILVQSVGYQETSKRTGIKYATLRQWARRGKWNQVVPKNYNNGSVTTVTTSPAQAHADHLQELEHKTRLSLAKSVNRMATDAESVTLKEAPYVHKAAQTAAIVHNWGNDSNKAPSILNLGVLIGTEPVRDSDNAQSQSNKSGPVIDVEQAE